jgi:hypothetical protein
MLITRREVMDYIGQGEKQRALIQLLYAWYQITMCMTSFCSQLFIEDLG